MALHSYVRRWGQEIKLNYCEKEFFEEMKVVHHDMLAFGQANDFTLHCLYYQQIMHLKRVNEVKPNEFINGENVIRHHNSVEHRHL